MTEPQSPLWTMDEAATYLRVSRSRLSRIMGEGAIEYIAFSDDKAATKYFTKDILDGYIDACRCG